MIKLNMDNRILNNLRQSLNEMISDEKGLVDTDTFRKMFFSYFSKEKQAEVIYNMLKPAVSVFWDEIADCEIDKSDPRACEQTMFVKI